MIEKETSECKPSFNSIQNEIKQVARQREPLTHHTLSHTIKHTKQFDFIVEYVTNT